MISLEDISFSYKSIIPFKKKDVFRNFNITFKKNAINMIIAKNGSGKTTLLKIIAGYIIADGGRIKIDNIQYDLRKYPYELFSLFSNPQRSFYHQLRVIENIDFFLKIESISYEKKDVDGFLDLLNLTQDILNERFSELSSGTMAKVVLLKTLLEKKEYLCLDEVLSNIDTKTTKRIIEYLKESSKRKTIIITTSKESELIKDANIIELKNTI